jgi:hypothetical protein
MRRGSTRKLIRMTTNIQAGYSGTPLAKKLGYKSGCSAVAVGAPEDYLAWLHPLPAGVEFGAATGDNTDLVHVFVTEQESLSVQLVALRRKLKPEACVWVSWPKKASRMPTDITEDTIRRLALPLGFVDVKVCAVSGVWSGLKLVVRKELRPMNAA